MTLGPWCSVKTYLLTYCLRPTRTRLLCTQSRLSVYVCTSVRACIYLKERVTSGVGYWGGGLHLGFVQMTDFMGNYQAKGPSKVRQSLHGYVLYTQCVFLKLRRIRPADMLFESVRCQAMLEEGLKKQEADHGILGESLIEHERTLADVQVSHLYFVVFSLRTSVQSNLAKNYIRPPLPLQL